MTLPLGARPLTDVVPDLDQLLADPAAYLAVRSVHIRKAKPSVSRFLLSFLRQQWFLITVAILMVAWSERWFLGWAIIAWIILSGVYECWRLYPATYEVVLRRDGIELPEDQQVVWCPWELFNAN